MKAGLFTTDLYRFDWFDEVTKSQVPTKNLWRWAVDKVVFATKAQVTVGFNWITWYCCIALARIITKSSGNYRWQSKLDIQGVPSISRHFCRPVARPVSTRAGRPASQIKRTLQDFRTRGWVTRSDNFGARYKQFSKKVHFLSYFGKNSRVSENFTGKNRQFLITWDFVFELESKFDPFLKSKTKTPSGGNLFQPNLLRMEE